MTATAFSIKSKPQTRTLRHGSGRLVVSAETVNIGSV